MNILIFNCGSSSQLFKVYESNGEQPFNVIASGKAKNVATRTQAEPQIDWMIGGATRLKKGRALLSPPGCRGKSQPSC